jgi:hypothetical protein
MIDDKAQARFWIKVDRKGPDDCWEWKASRSPKGYGYFGISSIKRSPFLAHRISFIIANGAIEEGLFIDHKCRNRGCVNPNHLRQVTPFINTMENSMALPALNVAKTHCPHGHEYTPENTKISMNGKRRGTPSRLCRTCANLYTVKYRLERKLAS